MSTDTFDCDLKAYEEDPRVACQYGVKCYQKNSLHKEKYKHPPKDLFEKPTAKKGMKRKIDDCDDMDEIEDSGKLQSKCRNVDVSSEITDVHVMPSPSISSSSPPLSVDNKVENSMESLTNVPNNLNDIKEIIMKLFLFDMPDDFYKFYDFCSEISADDPSSALQIVDLKLVGPYDVLNGIIKKIPDDDDDKEKYLRHWRYFYDPPEFQTILKGNDKQGLHYGYWRDECNEKPIFIAKNYATTSCKITAVASNIFGAVKLHIDERMKLANVFEKSSIARILKILTTFAKTHGISIEKKSKEMHDREVKVVANTFHCAGIVVPYDKKTQLGYRNLAATDGQLQKILKKISEAEFDEVKQNHLSKIEEIIRMATIAADECDFGTPLELGHDLLASGIESVHKIILNMFTVAYSLLHRPQFLKIAVAHMKDRKKGSNLSVI